MSRLSCVWCVQVVTPVTIERTVTLDVSGQPPVVYDLYGVVVHIGSTLEFGHYIAYRKESSERGLPDNSWWKCDDGTVTGFVDGDRLPEDVSGSGSATPYILFYQRQHIHDVQSREHYDPLLMHSVQCENGQYLTSLERGSDDGAAAQAKSWEPERDDSSGGSGRGRPYKRVQNRRAGHGFGGGSYIF